MKYPGTYLKTEPFLERYKVVANFLPDLSDKVVVDLNCGEPNFRKFIKYKRYVANDIFVPDNLDGYEFIHDTDTAVDVKADVLCVFGYGGGEHTGHPLESKTTGSSLVRLSEYKPKYIVIEMAHKWEDDFKIYSTLKEQLKDYKTVFTHSLDLGDHYHDKRFINILEKK